MCRNMMVIWRSARRLDDEKEKVPCAVKRNHHRQKSLYLRQHLRKSCLQEEEKKNDPRHSGTQTSAKKAIHRKSLQSKRKKEKPSISMALRSKKVFTCWRKSCRTWERERERGSVGEVFVRTPFSFTCIEKK